MEQLVQALMAYTEAQHDDGPFMPIVDRLLILRSDQPKPPNPMLFRPSLCIVVQGAKWAMFGGRQLEYRAGQALVIGVDTPSIGRVVEASPGEPCLVLVLALDIALLRGVAEALDPVPGLDAGAAARYAEPGRAVLVTDFQGALAECALRLVRLLGTPKALHALYPGIMREICYWLLNGPDGAEIARLTLANSPAQPVIRALQSLRERFRETVRVEALAAVAGMSVSAFHRQFKALTAMTPLQYQKQLRLLEARRLMVSNAVNAETASFEVGYESPSQFSREYARMFGAPPRRDRAALQVSLQEDRGVMRAG